MAARSPETQASAPWSIAEVRKLLEQVLPTDSDLQAFCLDHFPDVQRRFGDGQSRIQKTNLLLEYALPGNIAAALHRNRPEVLEEFRLTCKSLDEPGEVASQIALQRYLQEQSMVNARLHVSAVQSREAKALLRDVSIAELYVEPVLLDEKRVATLAADARRLLHALREPDLAETERHRLQSEIDRLNKASWEPDPQQGDRAPTERIPLSQLLPLHRHIVILGTPGAGKTTLLRYLCWAAVQTSDERCTRLSTDELLIPILLPLRQYAEVAGHESLADFLVQKGTDSTQRQALRQALYDGTGLVLLDALDEVPSESVRRRVRDAIAHFLHSFPRVRCVMTSRPYGYESPAPQLVELRLRHLDREQLREFVRKREAALASRSPEDIRARSTAMQRARSIIRQIESHRHLTTLSHNPLLLLLICEACQEGASLPAERVELYRWAIDHLLERWNEQRSLAAGPVAAKSEDVLPAQTLRQVFARVALRQRSEQLPVLHRQCLQDWLQEALSEAGVPNAGQQARLYVDAAAGQSGILDERGPGQFAFWHQTFEEYLAAVALADDACRDPAILIGKAGDPQFQEVFALAVDEIALVRQNRKLALGFVRQLSHSDAAPLESVLHTSLRRAALCIAGHAWIEPSLANEILERLVDAVQHKPYQPLQKDLAIALRGRPNLVPSPALRDSLLALLSAEPGTNISDDQLALSALRVLLNVDSPTASQRALYWDCLKGSDLSAQRTLAACGLVRCGEHDERVLLALSGLHEVDATLRQRVSVSLTEIRHELEPLLRKWTATSDPSVSGLAAFLLALMGIEDAGIRTLLLATLQPQEGVTSYGSDRRALVCDVLRGWAGRNDELRRLLLGALIQEKNARDSLVWRVVRQAAEERDDVLDDLVRMFGRHPQKLSPLLFALGAEDPRVYSRLRPLLSSRDLQERAAAASLCAALQPNDTSLIRESLVACLEAAEPTLRLRTAASLLDVALGELWSLTGGMLQQGQETLVCEPVLRACIVTSLRKNLGASMEPRQRFQSAVILVLLQAVDETVVSCLTDAQALLDSDRRDEVARVFRFIPQLREQILLRLAELVTHADRLLRTWTRERVAIRSSLLPCVGERLQLVLRGPDHRQSSFAALALAAGDVRTPEVIEALVRGLAWFDEFDLKEALSYLRSAGPLSVDHVASLVEYVEQEQKAERAAPVGSEDVHQASSRTRIRWSGLVELLTEQIAKNPQQQAWLADQLFPEHMSGYWTDPRPFPAWLLDRGNEAGRSLRQQLTPILRARLDAQDDPDLLWIGLQRCHGGLDFGEETENAYYRRCLACRDEDARVASALLLHKDPQSRGMVQPVLDASLASPNRTLQVLVCLRLSQESPTSSQVLDTLHSWLRQDDISVPALWAPGPAHPWPLFFVAVGAPQRVKHDPIQERLSHLLWEPIGERGSQEHKLSVQAAGTLTRLLPEDPELRQVATEWLQHPHPIRKLYGAYLLVQCRAWSTAMEDALLPWLDTDNPRLLEAAVLLLGRRPRTAVLVDARLGTWLRHATDETDEYDRLSQICTWQLFGNEVVQAWVELVAQAGTEAPFRRWWTMWQSLLRSCEREAWLAAALSAQHARTSDDAKWLLAVQIYQLGRASSAIWSQLAIAILDDSWRLGSLCEDFKDAAALVRRSPPLRDALRELLLDPQQDLGRRIDAARLLADADEPADIVAPLLREALKHEEAWARQTAALTLVKLGLPEDRQSCSTTLLQLAREPSLLRLHFSHLLQPIEAWPETVSERHALYACWMQQVLSGEDNQGSGLVEYLGTCVEAATYRRWLVECLERATPNLARDAFAQLSARWPDDRTLLQCAVRWVLDPTVSYHHHNACEYLVKRNLLAKDDSGLWSALRVKKPEVDYLARRLQSLARDPDVVVMIIDIAEGQSEPARTAMQSHMQDLPLSVSDVRSLADLVRHRGSEPIAQQIARAWLFHFLARGKGPPDNTRPASGPIHLPLSA